MSDLLVSESDFFPAETWCPECGGPPLNERAAVAYCQLHMPGQDGDADRATNFPVIITWSAEAGGEFNRDMCRFIHGTKEKNAP